MGTSAALWPSSPQARKRLLEQHAMQRRFTPELENGNLLNQQLKGLYAQNINNGGGGKNASRLRPDESYQICLTNQLGGEKHANLLTRTRTAMHLRATNTLLHSAGYSYILVRTSTYLHDAARSTPSFRWDRSNLTCQPSLLCTIVAGTDNSVPTAYFFLIEPALVEKLPSTALHRTSEEKPSRLLDG